MKQVTGTMFRSSLALLSCAPMLALLLMCASPAEAKRVALVIGNNDYENVPDLQKAVNDARALGKTLKDLDFEIITAENLTRRAMNQKLQEFAAKLGRGDEALFFFAGHGVQVSGQNFLLPTDIPNAKPGQEAFVRYESVGLHQVLDIIRGRGSRVAILVLDACRNNPFRREGTRSVGGTRGLAHMAAPEGTFIMYSAGAGQEALDTTGDDDAHPNSIFTRTLIPFLKTPGLKLTETARRVRRKVQKLAATTAHEQRPAYYDEVTGDFFFTPSDVEAPAPSLSTSMGPDETLWAAIKGSDKVSDFEFYLSRFPKGRYSAVAELKVEQLKTDKTVAEKTVKTEAELKDEPKIKKNVGGDCKKFFPAVGMTLTVACEEARAPAVAAKTPPPSIREESPSITKGRPSSRKKSTSRKKSSTSRKKSSTSRRKRSRSIKKDRKRRATAGRQARAAGRAAIRRKPRSNCNPSNGSNHFAGQYNRC